MSGSGLDKLLGRDMPEIAYLKKTNIAAILSKGLAETFRVKPNDPKTYFAKFLLNYAHEQKVESLREERQMAAVRARREAAKQREEEEEEKKAREKEDTSPAALMSRSREYFFGRIKDSQDLEDNLQELVEFIQEQTGSTGVYIGKLVHPSKEIDEEADDQAHLDAEAPKVIKFMHASKGQEFMVDVVLSQEQAQLSHEVFKEGEDGEGEEAAAEEGESTKEADTPKDIIDTFKHIFVPEVVREPKMHFQKVPRLGCFMAVPLVYNSCLFNDALEEAVEDYQVIAQQREEQAKQKAEYEEQQLALKQQKEEAGEAFEEEDQDWQELDFAPFKTFKEEYVICLDTLGQDRQFSDDEKRFTLQTIQQYRETWEAREVASLTADRDRKLDLMGVERDENQENEQQQEMQDAIDSLELDADYFDLQVVQDDSVLKEIYENQKMLQIEATWFQEKEDWKSLLTNIKQFKVLKMPHILQALFFLNKIERDRICEPNSNKLSWKKAKDLVEEELPTRMAKYTLWGEKKDEYRPYMRINYVEKIIEKYNQEEVDTYHAGLGKLFKWLKMAVTTRKQDIIRRKAIQKRNREEKTSREEAKSKREADREQYLQDREAEFNETNKEDIETYNKWQEEQKRLEDQDYGEEKGSEDEDAQANLEPPILPVFDRKEAEEKFDEENPPVEIPPDAEDDINNDWVLTEDEELEQINAFNAQKESI